MVEENIGMEIMLNNIGHRSNSIACNQKDFKEVGSIKAVDTGIDKNTCNMMPSDYLQDSYPSNNSCVWLSTCLVVRSIDPKQSEKMLSRFKDNQASYEWLRIFKRDQNEHSQSLFDMLRQTPGMCFDLCRVKLCKDYKSSTVTE